MRYWFTDQGQDFLLVDVNDKGTIISCQPFDPLKLVGQLHYDHFSDKLLEKGEFFSFSKSPDDFITMIKYPIKQVETSEQLKKRLEEIRLSIRAENISYGEIVELQSLIPYIEEGDNELLEAAVPEFSGGEA